VLRFYGVEHFHNSWGKDEKEFMDFIDGKKPIKRYKKIDKTQKTIWDV